MHEQDWLKTDKEQTCYRTGFTEPKKPNRGILATVLILSIFFCGIATTFRLLDIRLFREASKDSGISPASVGFSSDRDRLSTKDTNVPAFGFNGQDISDFEQLYYDVPAGLYITAVASGGPAEKAGILPGDVLLSLDGQQTLNLKVLEEQLAASKPGKKVRLRLHRQNTEYSVEICPEQ